MGDLTSGETAPGDSVDGPPGERDLAACAEPIRTRLLLADQERVNGEFEAERTRLSHELEVERARVNRKLDAERERANHDEAQLIRAICDLQAAQARMRDEFEAERARMRDEFEAERAKWVSASPLRLMWSWLPQSAKGKIRRLLGL